MEPSELPGGSGGSFFIEPEPLPISAQPKEWRHLAALVRLAFLNRDPHLENMSIDSKRLKKDCADAQATLAAGGHRLRRTGATATIEPILPLILELRAQKHNWVTIAAALAKQGVVQGVDREPITARRLTALISAINNRVHRQKAGLSGRAKRRDLAPFPANSQTLALSADLTRISATAIAAADSEATIRHQEFEDRVRSLLKVDST